MTSRFMPCIKWGLVSIFFLRSSTNKTYIQYAINESAQGRTLFRYANPINIHYGNKYVMVIYLNMKAV